MFPEFITHTDPQAPGRDPEEAARSGLLPRRPPTQAGPRLPAALSWPPSGTAAAGRFQASQGLATPRDAKAKVGAPRGQTGSPLCRETLTTFPSLNDSCLGPRG